MTTFTFSIPFDTLIATGSSKSNVVHYEVISLYLLAQKTGDNISLYLYTTFPNKWQGVKMNCDIAFLNEKENKCCPKTLDHEWKSGTGYGFPNLVSIKDAEKRKYLHNDNKTLKIWIKIKETNLLANHYAQINRLVDLLDRENNDQIVDNLTKSIKDLKTENICLNEMIENLLQSQTVLQEQLDSSVPNPGKQEIPQIPQIPNKSIETLMKLDESIFNDTALSVEELNLLSEKFTSFLSSIQKRIRELSICSVCQEFTTDTIFVPCGHKCCCKSCVVKVTQKDKLCPLCRVEFTQAIKVF